MVNTYRDHEDNYYHDYVDNIANPPPSSPPNVTNTYCGSSQLPTESDNENFWSESETEDSDEDEFDNGWTKNNSAVDAAFGWTIAYGDPMDDGRDLAAEELLGEDFEKEAADSGMHLIPS